MKRRLLFIVLLAFTVISPVMAQSDATHSGPVVSPPTNAPSADPVTAPAQAAPVSPAPDSQMMMPPANASVASPGAPAAPGGKAEDIEDIRPPFFYLHPWLWLWVLVILAALGAIGVLIWSLTGLSKKFKARSAYEITLEKLEKARALLDEENPEPYAVFVSETVRNYLGQRFHTPSTRRTTEEFLHQMQTDTATPLAEHRELLGGFLEACDLVKFAHYQPAREELEQVQKRAVTFVTATKPVEPNGAKP